MTVHRLVGPATDLSTRAPALAPAASRPGSPARSERGPGLGFAPVEGRAEMQGGSATASSEGPGRRGESGVRLPNLASPRRAVVPGPGHRAGEGDRASRILVVDDNVDSARGLARLLKFLGHEVRTAYDGHEAVDAAEAWGPGVVLLDIGLPGIDGFEVARRLRHGETCRDALIVAVTGYGQEEDRRRGREAGFDHHLVKPIDHDVLLSLLSAGAGGLA